MNPGLRMRDGLAVVETPGGRIALISGNSLSFEIDALARDVLSLCDGRDADGVVRALSGRYNEAEVREALGELQSLRAIEVGSLRRFLSSAPSFLAGGISPLKRALRRMTRRHGDGVLGDLRGDGIRDILLYTFSDSPAALRAPAALLRERFPKAYLLVWRPSGKGLLREMRAHRQALFDLVVGVHGAEGPSSHRSFVLTWFFGRTMCARRRVAYVDGHDFLHRVGGFHLLSAWARTKARCIWALQRAVVRGYAACAGLFRAPAPLPRAPRRIVVLAPGGIGDVVLSTPALRALRRRHPDAYLACVVPSGAESLFKGGAPVDDIIPSPVRGQGGVGDFLKRFSFARAIRNRGFDTAITLRHWPGQSCDGYLPFMAGIPRRVGPALPDAGETSRLFTHPVRVTSRHQADTALEVSGGWGEGRSLHLETAETDRESVAEYLKAEGIEPGDLVVGIHPGSSAEVKQWPPERFARTADALVLRWGARVVLSGGPDEVKLAWEVARHMATAPVIAAGNLSLSESIALIARCDLFICGDSGPMHIATAVGTPVVALFGPTDPARWGPRAVESRVVRRRMICGPRPACSVGPYPACPRGNPVCMNTLPMDEVLRAAEDLLGERVGTPDLGVPGERR